MALSLDSTNTRGRGRRRGRSRRALSEINVTPLVDVMLVLLIIFMVSAPLLTVGVPLELPKTEAGAMDEQNQPLNVSIKADGGIFLQDSQVPFEGLAAAMHQVAGTGFDKPIYVRADGKAPYAVVAQVMAAISAAGFAKIGLITDTGGPTSGARETKVDAAIAPGLAPAPR
ncbi:protein TolR [Caulobacter sp. CCUG 60055]|uniref:ExbD/TolR family protein n=1 Tax=Caulobacter sp. CCUG 60055 TaxID=2100090 RepID=UPI001FA6C147|nr:ExbD/TolR family protein [Caulobacter sp. CCUG 60055]MBQ1542941.1 ExbD/TolR family protein [Caulobacteraceae bacterium]MCI3180148.1 protein TolR [Caulobacter sp. CCUG 60055]